MSYVVGLPNNLYKSITNTAWVRTHDKKKGALDSPPQVIVYQLLAHDRWFSPGTPSSSTTKAGHQDIAESGIKHNKSGNIWPFSQSSYINDMHVYHYRTFSSIIFKKKINIIVHYVISFA